MLLVNIHNWQLKVHVGEEPGAIPVQAIIHMLVMTQILLQLIMLLILLIDEVLLGVQVKLVEKLAL